MVGNISVKPCTSKLAIAHFNKSLGEYPCGKLILALVCPFNFIDWITEKVDGRMFWIEVLDVA